jgi:hypothetical protein
MIAAAADEEEEEDETEQVVCAKLVPTLVVARNAAVVVVAAAAAAALVVATYLLNHDCLCWSIHVVEKYRYSDSCSEHDPHDDFHVGMVVETMSVDIVTYFENSCDDSTHPSVFWQSVPWLPMPWSLLDSFDDPVRCVQLDCAHKS